jgi:hypothetical protein
MHYGNPQMGAPLSEACRRVTESEAWNACCEKFPEDCKNFCDESLFEPYDRNKVSLFGDPLRHVFCLHSPEPMKKIN